MLRHVSFDSNIVQFFGTCILEGCPVLVLQCMAVRSLEPPFLPSLPHPCLPHMLESCSLLLSTRYNKAASRWGSGICSASFEAHALSGNGIAACACFTRRPLAKEFVRQ